MKRMITTLLLFLAIIETNAQMITRKEAAETIVKGLVGLEYDSPVFGDMGYKKIATVEIGTKDMFTAKDKAGKDLFWFNIENTTIDYKNDMLSIWYGTYNRKVKSNKNTGSKIASAFKKLKEMDENGVEVYPSKDYDDVGSFSEGLAPVELNGKYGFIDQQGKEMIPLKYDKADPFEQGLARVQLNGKYGFIDQRDNAVIPIKYEHMYIFTKGLVPVKLNGKYGYIDKKNNVAIPFKYDDAVSFIEGFSRVQLNGKYGFIDLKGNEIIPLKYDDASMFFIDGIARVKLNGKWLRIDSTGKVVE